MPSVELLGAACKQSSHERRQPAWATHLSTFQEPPRFPQDVPDGNYMAGLCENALYGRFEFRYREGLGENFLNAGFSGLFL